MIFVDSSFWIATRFPRDDRHEEAVELLAQYASAQLVTSSQVRGETWTFLRSRASHSAAVHFLDRLARSPRLRVDFIAEALEEQALSWLRRHDEREYSFVDATSFALMRKLGIRKALAFDGDFAAAGFTELRV